MGQALVAAIKVGPGVAGEGRWPASPGEPSLDTHHLQWGPVPLRTAALTVLALSLIVPTALVGISSTQALSEPALDPAERGAWSDPIPAPASAEHAAVLPTGEVLIYQTAENVQLWDPGTGEFVDVSMDTHESINCAGLAMLPDGRLLAVSGHSHAHLGVPDPESPGTGIWSGHRETFIFDPWNRTWIEGPELSQGRYYPTAITLGDGSVLTVSGNDESGGPAETVERMVPGEGWSTLPSAERSMDFYPRLHQLPNGDVVRVGQEQRSLFLDTDTWTWSQGPDGNYGQRWGGVSAMLPGLDRVLVTGGGSWGFGGEGHQTAGVLRDDVGGIAENVVDGLTTGGQPATGHTEVLDLSGDEPTFEETEPMTFPRRDLALVLLADGDALAVGGGSGWEAFPGWVEHARSPELFDAEDETWSLMAPADRHRGYHSTAVLLPDGRVLVGGGDVEASTTGADEEPASSTISIFSPPYLFQGSRPSIETAPDKVTYGDGSFTVTSPDAGDVSEVTLVRMGATTHSLNTDQRVLEPSFTRDGTALTVDAPDDGARAPPGAYMLFLVDGEGVPSVAATVMVGPGGTLAAS